MAFDVLYDEKARDENLALAKSIKKFRIDKGLTLAQLAEKTGFNVSYISKIENAKNSPPIATLSKIARALGINIADLFKDTYPQEIFALTKACERIKVARQGHFIEYSYESINHRKKKKNFDAFIVTLPGQSKPSSLLFDHEGEEMLYVLEGVIEFNFNNNIYKLKEGDCIHFDSSYPHNGRSAGDRESKALLIIYSQNK